MYSFLTHMGWTKFPLLSSIFSTHVWNEILRNGGQVKIFNRDWHNTDEFYALGRKPRTTDYIYLVKHTVHLSTRQHALIFSLATLSFARVHPPLIEPTVSPRFDQSFIGEVHLKGEKTKHLLKLAPVSIMHSLATYYDEQRHSTGLLISYVALTTTSQLSTSVQALFVPVFTSTSNDIYIYTVLRYSS